MKNVPPVVALEIGTSKICALVGEIREDQSLIVTGMGECPSRGVRKGQVVDLENAVACVRTALHTAEDSGHVAIEEVHVAVSGANIDSAINGGSVPVLDPEEGISDEDIEQVRAVARAINLPPDRLVLHTISQHYHIDDHKGVINPKGMVGAKLSLSMLIVHGVRTPMQNTLNVVRSVPMDVGEAAFSGLCSALAVLTAEQKRSGVVLIDMGGGTTDFVAYAGNTVAQVGSFGVGGDHITNDIVSAFNVSTAQAERLKREAIPAVVPEADNTQRINLPPELGFRARSIRVTDLDLVIGLRVEETLLLVKNRLEQSDLLRQVGAGVVLTGGGAQLKNIEAIAERVFGLPSQTGKPRDVSGPGTVTERTQYATPLGLIRYGFRNAAAPERRTGFGRWLRGFVGSTTEP
ncbi:MAG: cell division protein FtsA [Kiritimatiellae bacterium]|nr:cell division protein FtsA [Kiritimatiellia bacterium]